MASNKSTLMIRDYENIRRILRDIYIFGCFTKADFVEMGYSGRKVDKEQQRISAYLPEKFLKKRRVDKKVIQYCRYSISESTKNYLAETYRNKSFTLLDIMSYFYILQILGDGEERTLPELLDELPYSNINVEFTKDNLRIKLDELVENRFIKLRKDGRNVRYSISADIWESFTEEELAEIWIYLEFIKNISPLEMPYYFLQRRLKLYMILERNVDLNLINPFQFKHNHIFNSLDNDILIDCLMAIHSERVLKIEKDGGVKTIKALPITTNANREYVCPWCDDINPRPMFLQFKDRFNVDIPGTLVKGEQIKKDVAVHSFVLRDEANTITNITRYEEYYKKHNDAQIPKILVTSFQHEAVENVIVGMDGNGLPSERKGGKRDGKDKKSISIREWRDSLTEYINAEIEKLTPMTDDEHESLRDRIYAWQSKGKDTEYELSEMQRALDQEENYLVQIKNLSSELSSRKSELERLNNSIFEYEQLRAQMDLLRTLNEHLRSELDNTKRMLESNVGEICPALTSIDIEENSDTGKSYVAFQERIDNRNDGRVNTLKELVDHVKTYAAAQQKPLFYSDRDLRAFVAGMAASPMAILQGMSGTGKTSLPKIFSEAIMGEISVVPVESSWRDRNELLGYYNDFSKKFTAKEFTCDLYKAGCKRYEDTIYFIVLDEMNLSRVEYYFADFLSVLEDKKENWKIRLVDTDMRKLPTEITDEVIKELENDKKEKNKEILAIINKIYPNQKLSDEEESSISASDKLRLISYLSERQARIDTPSNCRVGGPQNLIEGNTIQIPRNVWFIGTANRDESTFEITDKVYDRAQVLNFNNRAKGVKLSSDNGRVFITYNELNMMFMKARGSKLFHFKAEDNELLQKIEQILKNYFRISYGNRIQDQMDIFVPVYVMAGLEDASQKDDKKIDLLINEAIDYQLTNKVLRKLEYEDINKDAAEKLRKLFEPISL